MKEKVRSLLYVVSTLLLLLGTLGLMFFQWYWAAWIIIVGSLGYSSSHVLLLRDLETASLRKKRLLRLGSMAGFLWLVAGIMVLNHIDIWALLIIAAVIFMAYSDIARVLLDQKEDNRGEKKYTDQKKKF